jgi:putative alpha-1,2-mannosidase
VRVYPIRKDYLDDQITCFPLTAVSHRLGEVFALRPVVGKVEPASWEARMPYDHDLEVTRPWYFSTFLLKDGITVEFTPGRLTGYYRLTFPASSAPSLLLDLFNDGEGYWHFPDAMTIEGMETWQGGVKVFLYGSLDHPATAVARDSERRQALSFTPGTTVVGLRYAISFISAAQAKKNYAEEIAGKSFDVVKQHAANTWAAALGRIHVEGGTPAQRRSFFTALYRCHERMVNISEDGQYYSGYDHRVETDKRPFYVDDWSWDTYLALHPFREILHPAQEEDMLQSYVRCTDNAAGCRPFPCCLGTMPA